MLFKTYISSQNDYLKCRSLFKTGIGNKQKFLHLNETCLVTKIFQIFEIKISLSRLLHPKLGSQEGFEISNLSSHVLYQILFQKERHS